MRQTVIPQFRITEAETSKYFYVDGLGFPIDWDHLFEPGFPLFMQLSRAGQTIFLTQHIGDCEPGGAVYFIVPDADSCLAAFKAKGIRPVNDISDTPWGTREFMLADPDGNRLRFASHPDA